MKPLSTPDVEQELSIPAVFGLSKTDRVDWSRLRGLTPEGIAKLSFYRVWTNAALGVFVAQLFLPTVGPLLLGLWFFALVAIQIHGAVRERQEAFDGSQGSPSAVARQMTMSVSCAVLWGVALAYFPQFGTQGEAMAMLIVAALLMALS